MLAYLVPCRPGGRRQRQPRAGAGAWEVGQVLLLIHRAAHAPVEMAAMIQPPQIHSCTDSIGYAPIAKAIAIGA